MTKVFNTYEEFLARKDKNVNGVSPEFTAEHPKWEKTNETNRACWNCVDCYDCEDCWNCVDCRDCEHCMRCLDCEDCEACKSCNHCTGCARCKNCWRCDGYHDCTGDDGPNYCEGQKARGTECGTEGQMTYEELGAEIGRLVQTKNEAYGDSFIKAGQVMQILYPGGIGEEQLDDALVVVRILDKLFRIATNKDAMGESPYRDIAGYGLLGAMKGGGKCN